MRSVIVMCSLTVLLSACSTVSDLPPRYTLGGETSEGLAIVSLTLSGKDMATVSEFEYRVRKADQAGGEVTRRPYFLSARQQARWLQDRAAQGPMASRIRVIVKGQSSGEPLDVVASGRASGRVSSLRLPPGEYEIYDWKMVVPNQYGGDEYSPKRAFSYPFRIAPGRATYLGSLNLRLTDEDTYSIAVENRAERDLALLAKKVPSVRIENVIDGVGKIQP